MSFNMTRLANSLYIISMLFPVPQVMMILNRGAVTVLCRISNNTRQVDFRSTRQSRLMRHLFRANRIINGAAGTVFNCCLWVFFSVPAHILSSLLYGFWSFLVLIVILASSPYLLRRVIVPPSVLFILFGLGALLVVLTHILLSSFYPFGVSGSASFYASSYLFPPLFGFDVPTLALFTCLSLSILPHILTLSSFSFRLLASFLSRLRLLVISTFFVAASLAFALESILVLIALVKINSRFPFLALGALFQVAHFSLQKKTPLGRWLPACCHTKRATPKGCGLIIPFGHLLGNILFV